MERVVIVGAGLYGLITAKTYLQVAGVYDEEAKGPDATDIVDDIPDCFTGTKHGAKTTPGCNLLVVDAASDIGGTWAEERLYPNLLSQNSYGLYEFSDLPLSEVVPEEEAGVGQQFIAGWKINRYLHAWIAKWRLRKHIRLNWRVTSIQRLESKEWKLNITLATAPERTFSLVCDKLILATGLTSVPNLPNIHASQAITKKPAPVIHAKDIGEWARAHLGYQPMPDAEKTIEPTPEEESGDLQLRSVAIYGGAKSSFDLMHFFATLHRKDPGLHLTLAPKDPVQVHWIIREKGTGPAWMAPPTSALPNGDIVASDKAASTRFLRHLAPCSYETPKRLALQRSAESKAWSLRLEGSWLARLFHGNPLGRWWIRWFWDSVDRSLEGLAQYEAESKMQLLRPHKSVISCGSSIGIANQPDLWETIRSPQVKVYRSTIAATTGPTTVNEDGSINPARISLTDGVCIDNVDLIVHATGYKPIVPIKFDPPSFRLMLGLSGLVNTESARDNERDESSDATCIPKDFIAEECIQHWETLDREIEPAVRETLAATRCIPIDHSAPSWTGEHELLPYRLFRRMVAPKLVAEGDRSFATLGVVLTSTIAVVAEVQALWVTAFVTGGLDSSHQDHSPCHSESLCLETVSRATLDKTVSEDVVLGSLTGTGLEVDAIHYNDILMRDLGLNPYRLGGGLLKELTGVYEPSAYAGIVDEWRKSRGRASSPM